MAVPPVIDSPLRGVTTLDLGQWAGNNALGHWARSGIGNRREFMVSGFGSGEGLSQGRRA